MTSRRRLLAWYERGHLAVDGPCSTSASRPTRASRARRGRRPTSRARAASAQRQRLADAGVAAGALASRRDAELVADATRLSLPTHGHRRSQLAVRSTVCGRAASWQAAWVPTQSGPQRRASLRALGSATSSGRGRARARIDPAHDAHRWRQAATSSTACTRPARPSRADELRACRSVGPSRSATTPTRPPPSPVGSPGVRFGARRGSPSVGRARCGAASCCSRCSIACWPALIRAARQSRLIAWASSRRLRAACTRARLPGRAGRAHARRQDRAAADPRALEPAQSPPSWPSFNIRTRRPSSNRSTNRSRSNPRLPRAPSPRATSWPPSCQGSRAGSARPSPTPSCSHCSTTRRSPKTSSPRRSVTAGSEARRRGPVLVRCWRSLARALEGRHRYGLGRAPAEGRRPRIIEALAARGDLHDLEVCHAMALSKDAGALGRVMLDSDSISDSEGQRSSTSRSRASWAAR